MPPKKRKEGAGPTKEELLEAAKKRRDEEFARKRNEKEDEEISLGEGYPDINSEELRGTVYAQSRVPSVHVDTESEIREDDDATASVNTKGTEFSLDGEGFRGGGKGEERDHSSVVEEGKDRAEVRKGEKEGGTEDGARRFDGGYGSDSGESGSSSAKTEWNIREDVRRDPVGVEIDSVSSESGGHGSGGGHESGEVGGHVSGEGYEGGDEHGFGERRRDPLARRHRDSREIHRGGEGSGIDSGSESGSGDSRSGSSSSSGSETSHSSSSEESGIFLEAEEPQQGAGNVPVAPAHQLDQAQNNQPAPAPVPGRVARLLGQCLERLFGRR